VILFADTFNRYFDPHIPAAADAVLERAGFTVSHASPEDGGRPLCCGRTFLAAGLVEEARTEMRRTARVLRAAIETGSVVVGLEPSCIMTFRDEAPSLLGQEWTAKHGESVLMFEEFLAGKAEAGKLNLPLAAVGQKALLHGHCHQKAFGALSPVQKLLGLIPDLSVETVNSSCCGMAGSFGYQAETADVSRAMAELSLAPAVRAADPDTLIIADGTSCRHQIADCAGRKATHVAEVLHRACVNAASGPK
jgi:Fe-S oxidoreductase